MTNSLFNFGAFCGFRGLCFWVVPSFTLIDILRTTEAALVLTLILFIPGFVIGWLANVLQFRERRPVLRALLSTPIGIAVMPVAIFLLGPYPILLWALFAATWVIFLALAWERRLQFGIPRMSWEVGLGAVFVAAWALLAVLVLADLQWNHRLYFSVPAYDHCVRTAFTAAAMRGIPPTNPFLAGVPAVPLRYHYFWMLVCSLVCRLAGIMPRHAMYGSVIWAGIAVMSLIGVALKFLVGVTENIERKTLLGCALLAVTGLDLLPTLYVYAKYKLVYMDMEWWNVQIASWVDTLFWTPHHLMALVACLTGFLVLRQPVLSRRERLVKIVLAGAAFASAAGLSTLVTFTFAVFVAGWMLVSVHYQWWDEIALFSAAGALAMLIALPFLRALLAPGASASAEGGFLQFAVRDFPLAMYRASRFREMKLALLLPVSYFLELGFFLVVAVLRWRLIRKRQAPVTREEIAAWTLVAVSFLTGSFFRSATLSFNDLGWRCFLQAQFIFLLWAALLLDDWWNTRKRVPTGARLGRAAACGLLVLGILGTAYQVAVLRFGPILYDQNLISWAPNWLDADRHIGSRVFALRSIYDKLWARLPVTAVVQYNPLTPTYIPHLLYSGHDAAMGMMLCGVVFGGNIPLCKPRVDAIASLFVTPKPADSGRLDSTCQAYGIRILVVEDTDAVWKQPDSWVWTRTPLLANDRVRAFQCGSLEPN